MQTEPAFVAVPKHAGQVAHTVQVIAAGQCKQHTQQLISINLRSIALTYSEPTKNHSAKCRRSCCVNYSVTLHLHGWRRRNMQHLEVLSIEPHGGLYSVILGQMRCHISHALPQLIDGIIR